MDKKTSKIDHLVKNYLNQSKQAIRQAFGQPNKKSDNEVWIYNRYRYGIFKEEISFLFEDDKVNDVVLTEYLFCIEMYAIYYYSSLKPPYRIVK